MTFGGSGLPGGIDQIIERRPGLTEAYSGDSPVDGELYEEERDAGEQKRHPVDGAIPGPEQGRLNAHGMLPS
jgi:hypothetical protein